MAASELPEDVSGIESRDLCDGRVGSDQAPTGRLAAMAEQREALVTAIDQTLPASLTEPMSGYLLRIRSLYADDGALPEVTSRGAAALQYMLADPELAMALQRMSARGDGFVQARLAVGIAATLLRYPRLDALLDTLLPKLEEGGPLRAPLHATLEALALEMVTLAPTPDGEESDLSVARQLLFDRAVAFSTGAPTPVALRDPRGLPLPGPAPDLATLLPDADGDGLIDLDGDGRPVGADGRWTPIPPPMALPSDVPERASPASRDALGRALTADGQPLYRYLDADETVLSALMSEAVGLLEVDGSHLLDVGAMLPVWLGPRADRTRAYGAHTHAYLAFETDQGPALDFAYALSRLLTYPEIDDVLVLLQRLLREHEPELAGVVGAAMEIDRLAADDPHAQLAAGSVFFDDLLAWAAGVAQQEGLLPSVLTALADERGRYLGGTLGEAMRYRDLITYDPDDINRLQTNAKFDTPVDRSAPNHFDNQSLFQRTVLLIKEANGVALCNKAGAVLLGIYPFGGFPECAFLQIDNALRFFVDAAVGTAVLPLAPDLLIDLLPDADVDLLLEQESGITGFDTTPSVESLTRLLLTPLNPFMLDLVDPIRLQYGALALERHRGSLFGLEREFAFPPGEPVTIKSTLVPLAEAFEAHDRESDERYLFGELLSVLASHWPAPDNSPEATTQGQDPGAPFFAHQSNLVSFEPLVATAFDPAGIDFVGRLQPLLRTIANIEVRPGVDGRQALAGFIAWLVDPEQHANLTYRDGRTQSLSQDGQRSLPATPMSEIRDTLSTLDAAYADAPAAQGRWLRARSTFLDQLLTVEQLGEAPAFANPRAPALMGAFIDFTRDRLARHTTAQARQAWALDLIPSLAESLATPMAAATSDLLVAIDADPTAKAEVLGLVRFLLATQDLPMARAVTVAGMSDLLQLLDEPQSVTPLMRSLAVVLAPDAGPLTRGAGSAAPTGSLSADEGLVVASLRLLRRLRELDEDEILMPILQNLVTPVGDGARAPLEVFLDAIVDINRVDAGQATPLDAADHVRVLGRAANFLDDREHGLQRLYDVINSRTLAP